MSEYTVGGRIPVDAKHPCAGMISVDDRNFHMAWVTEGIGEADQLQRAKLFAAAPQLLAACKHVFDMIEVELYESDPVDQWHVAAARLKAAIAKATGEGNE